MARKFYTTSAPLIIAGLLVAGGNLGLGRTSIAVVKKRPVLASASTATAVLTQHNDNSRTGANLNETLLNTSNVTVSQFGKLFSRSVDGFIFGQPLYASAVSIAGMGIHNVVYVATEHDSVYAFDADNPQEQTPLWQVSLGTAVPSTDISLGYASMGPEIGITSTPVIDPNLGTIFVEAKSVDSSGNYHQMLHALDMTTGSEQLNSPVEVTGTFEGTGYDNVDGVITFTALRHLNRPGLLLSNGMIYLAFGSHSDIDPYHGWIMAYDETTLQQVAVYVTTPDGGRGALWQAGQGLLADSSGNIYMLAGNGTCDATINCGRNLGDSAIKLSPTLTVTDWFTPDNRGQLDELDLDLGGGGPILLPGQALMVGGGKDGVLRLINTDDMGHFNTAFDDDVEEFTASPGFIMTAPVYWSGPAAGPSIYLWTGGDFLKQYVFSNGRFTPTPASEGSIESLAGGSNCPALSLSANGSQQGTGIVWVWQPLSGNGNGIPNPGVLRAFDASNVANELWDSTQNSTRDNPGLFAKFCPPTIANGKVYVASFSGVLDVYGLIPSGCSATLSTNSQQVSSAGGTESVSVTAPTGCAWNPTTNSDFISIITGAQFSGTGTQTYQVSPNSGPARSGTITILNQQLTVSQATGCDFSISPDVVKFAANGGTGTASVQTGSACSWTAASTVKWIEITSGGSGTGPSVFSYTVGKNDKSTRRTGQITINGQNLLTIKQRAK
jgi:hypothetical protein